MVRNTTRSFGLPKAAALVAALGVAVGLAMAAPVRAASPSTAAARIVQARHHKDAGPAWHGLGYHLMRHLTR